MENRRRFAVAIGVIVVCGLFIALIVIGPGRLGFRSPSSRADKTESTAGASPHPSKSESESAANSKLTAMSPDAPAGKEASRNGSDGAINFGTYESYLNSLCRRLTPAEEDVILANSNRDPRVLLGLALAGSSRADQFLREALEKDPENPLIHYSILRRVDPGFDRLASAQKLVSLVPNDGELWYAAAAVALDAGNRTMAIDYLRKAATQPEFASMQSAELATRIEAYQWGGSTEEMARTRALLECHQSTGDMALVKLQEYLLSEDLGFAGPFEMSQGKEEMAALLLSGAQKAAKAKDLSLDSYYGTLGMEMEILRSFFKANVTGENVPAARYLQTPASTLLSTADATFEDLAPVLMFSYDKPGIFRRLSGDQQQELIQRIQQDGEVSAFSWAYQERPDIFRSPNFKPQGQTKKNWTEYLQRFGIAPNANQKR